MNRFVVVASICLVSVSLVCSGQTAESGPKELTAEIEKLISQLGADEFVTRENAQAKLEKLGLEAFDALHQAQENDDIEVAMRARYLVRSLQVDWSKETDPPKVREILSGYGGKSEPERKSRIETLGEMGVESLDALCRLVRFESSDRLSKRAALLVLNLDFSKLEGEEKAKALNSVRDTVAASKRDSSVWLRSFAESAQNDEYAVDTWRDLLKKERRIMVEFPENSSPGLVRDFYRWLAGKLIETDSREQALVVMKDSLELLDGSRDQLVEAIDWLETQDAWPIIENLAARFPGEFDEVAILKYRLAEAQLKQGNAEQAAKTAAAALEMDAGSPEQHVITAYSLEERGLRDWAIQEYEKIIRDEEDGSLDNLRARFLLSEMHHDQLNDLQAAELLQGAVKAIDKNDATREVAEQRLGRTVGSLKSRMHYFFAEHHRVKGEVELQMKELLEGVKHDPTDADLLIGMYRVDTDDKEFLAETKKRIDTAVGNFRTQMKQSESQANSARSEAIRTIINRQWAVACNQLAWLVGNTTGDIEEAIAASEKSLELRPDSAGYLDTLGHCHFRAGNFEEAVKVQKRAVKIDAHSGALQRALEQFSKALEEKEAGDK
jgi:tetratricopeptide (TPR) repeat protein